MASTISALTIDTSSMIINWSLLMSLRCSLRMRLSELRRSSLSLGGMGLKGKRKKEWMVCPPALSAEIPVGASMTCSFLVWALTCLRSELLPVPARPVRKILRLVSSTSCRRYCISRFSGSGIRISGSLIVGRLGLGCSPFPYKEGGGHSLPYWR